MFHMELFTSSIATGALTQQQLNYFAVQNILPPLVNGVQVSPRLYNVHSIMGVGAHLATIRGQATSMLPFPYPSLGPNNRGGGFESPARIWDFSRNPIPLKPTEEFDVFGSQDSGGAETEYVAVNFSDGLPTPYPVPMLQGAIAYGSAQPGRFFSVHWTASLTCTGGTWNLFQPAFDQALPPGVYALIGARVQSATGLFFRMYPSQDPQWRPGGIAVQAYDQLDPPNQRAWQQGYPTLMGWGTWLTFWQNVPPQVQLFCTGADAAEEGWFDLLYVSSQVTASP